LGPGVSRTNQDQFRKLSAGDRPAVATLVKGAVEGDKCADRSRRSPDINDMIAAPEALAIKRRQQPTCEMPLGN
jgi:hypothetical protein